MKKILFIVVCCFLFIPLSAQKLFLAQKEEINLRIDDFAVIGKYKQSTLVYKKSNEDAEIIFYDTKMNVEKRLALDFLPSHFSSLKCVCNEDNLRVFFEVKENKKQNLYATKYIADNNWTTPILINTKPVSFIKNYEPFDIAVSENEDYAMFYSSYFLNGDNTVQLVVVDNNLKITTEVNQIFTEKSFYITSDASVSNTGIPFLIVTDKMSNRGNAEVVNIFTAMNSSSNFLIFPILLENHVLSDIHLKLDNKNNNLYVASFFADGKYSNPRGVFYSIFNIQNQQTSATHFIPLALQITKNNSGLKDLKMKDITIKSNGGIEIATEKYFKNMRTINSINPIFNSAFASTSNSSQTVTEFSYDEIVLFNIKTDGSLNWSQTILKEQMSTDDGGIYSSFAPFLHRNGIAYIFNDMSTKESRLLASYITSKGEMTMKEIQTDEDMDSWNLMPRSAVQISNSEIVMPCLLKNHLSFLKIIF